MAANHKGRVAGKTALVTGAGRGLGRCIAQRLAAEGASVFVTDILREQVERTAEIITGAGGIATALTHDVVDPEAWREVVRTVGAQVPQLDILVNNAGHCVVGNIEELPFAEWQRMIAVNLDSVFLGTQSCLPLLKASKGASIVNMSSIGAMVGASGFGAYSAAKGGIRAFTKTAAIEFAQRGHRIRVNSLHPGPVSSEQGLGLMQQLSGLPADAARAALGSTLPLGRVGTPEDVASAVLFLASDEASWVTGVEWIIDGGDTAR